MILQTSNITSNQKSGKKSPPVTGISGNNLNEFGMGSNDFYKDFDTSFAQAGAQFDPFDSSRLDEETERNRQLFSNARSIGNVGETLTALGNARSANLTAGQQLANNASQQFTEQSLPGGTSGVGASMIRAQALLPFLQQDYAGAADERKYADSKKAEAITTASGIAQTLAGLATSYTNSLANYNAQKAGMSLDFADRRASGGLDASRSQAGNRLDLLKTQLQLQENARQFDTSQNLNQSQFDFSKQQYADHRQDLMFDRWNHKPPIFAGQMGFTPSGGVMRPTPEYVEYKNRHGQY